MLQGIAALHPDLVINSLVTIKRVIRESITRFLLPAVFTLFLCTPTTSYSETQANQQSQKNAVESTQVEAAGINNSVATNTVQQKKTTEQYSGDQDLINIQAIVQTGAIRLALLSLDKQQPDYKTNPIRWINWERERITLLNLSNQHKVLVERINSLPKKLNPSFFFWAKTQQASAYMKLQNFEQARQSLLDVIWSVSKQDSEINNKWLPHWRRMIIHSYLNQGLLKDAHISITRFRQDYGQGDVNDIILYARVLLMNKLVDEALTVLAAHTRNPEAGMLYLLAQLRKDSRSPRKILQASLRQMQGDWVKPELKTYLWSIVAEAAKRSEDRLSAIKAMEFVLADPDNKHIPKGLFNITVNDLWTAYIDNAIKIGNRAQYLMGDDPVWLNAAQVFDTTQPINARSLYAFLILRGQDKKVKKQATVLFLKSLLQVENGKELVKQLFLASDNFETKNELPFTIRHFLIDYALAGTDIRLASELMSTIKTSPQGTDKFMWQLRRARVLVMGGKADVSATSLIELLEQQKEMKADDIDKLMQVVFDLQTVKAHQQAYRVFEKIIPHISDAKRLREIYYWMADSKKAQQQYAEAAMLYLRSAALPSENTSSGDLTAGIETGLDPSLDPWGQTARYQAASNLAKAGLIDDARTLYNKLLDTTKEESRVKVLKHELQQLWLLENQSAN